MYIYLDKSPSDFTQEEKQALFQLLESMDIEKVVKLKKYESSLSKENMEQKYENNKFINSIASQSTGLFLREQAERISHKLKTPINGETEVRLSNSIYKTIVNGEVRYVFIKDRLGSRAFS